MNEIITNELLNLLSNYKSKDMFYNYQIKSFEELRKVEESLSSSPEWVNVPSEIKNEILHDIQKELAEQVFNEHRDKLSPPEAKKPRGRKPKVVKEVPSE